MLRKSRARAYCAAVCMASTAVFAGDSIDSVVAVDSVAAANMERSAMTPAPKDTVVSESPAVSPVSSSNSNRPVVTEVSNEVKLDISGKVVLQEGQFVKGHFLGPYPGLMTYPVWNHRSYAQLRFDAFFGKRMHIIAAPEVRLWTNTYPEDMEGDKSGVPFRQWSYVSIADGEGIISIGNGDNPIFEFAAGVMPFKYNPDAYNLGEYLFRSGAYPPYLITLFEYAYARLSGLRLTSTLIKNLRQDLLLTIETQVMPLFDWSLSYLISYKVPLLLDMGAGVSLYRWFPMSDKITSPKLSENQYTTETGAIDHYTFKGIKLMGRLSFDPKGVLPEGVTRLLGKEDGKLFVEAGILGLKNYPAYVRAADSSLVPDTLKNYYGDIKQRIPVMFGCNFPCFKLLDVLSIQGEWFKWRYLNSYLQQVYQGSLPIPMTTKGDVTLNDLKKGYVKWSVYAKKQVIPGFSIVGQCAYDHTFHEYYYESYRSDAEVFIKKGEWGWWLQLQYAF